MKTPRIAVLLATALLGALAAPALFGAKKSGDRPSPDDEALLRRYSEILAAAAENYVEAVPPEKLVAASIRGMLQNLDPHTSFLESEEYGAMQEKQHGSFFGLGIIVSKRDGKVTVISPIEGTPAQRLGLRPGDVISEIEGKPVGNEPIDEIVKKLKGPKGTQVSITIARPGFGEAIHLTITRAEIPTVSVRYAFMAAPDTGYLKITDFTRITGREVRDALSKLEKEGAQRLVLDLRGNPGGILDQSVEVADMFLDKGEMVVYTEGRTPSSYQKYVAPGRRGFAKIPVVVLIDNGSASASEIVAGALQDHDRALVVGTRSWGKGLVQSVYNLSDGSGLALTTARYFTPSGRCIQRDYSNFIDYVLTDAGHDDELEPEEGAEEPIVIDPAPGDGKFEEKKPQPPAKDYRTDAGRKVTGGGGIIPDVTVTQNRASRLHVRLLSRGLFFSFAVDWANRHPEIARDYRLDDATLAEFRKFVATQKGQPLGDAAAVDTAFSGETDISPIRRALEIEILNARFDLEAGFRRGMEGDKQYQEALRLLPDAEKLAVARRPKPGKSS